MNSYYDTDDGGEYTDLENFTRKYRAIVADSKEFRCPEPITATYAARHKGTDPYLDDSAIAGKLVPMLAIHMRSESFLGLLAMNKEMNTYHWRLEDARQKLNEISREEKAREKNPAAKLAYEQYKLLMSLTQ